MNKPDEITIVGAGLVGSMLALMLGNLGYRVKVLEKRGDMRNQTVDGGRSINLALAERGIHALKKAGLMKQVEPLLIPMKGRMLHDVTGALDFLPYGQKANEVIYSVSRSGLNALMMTAAESSERVSIEFEQELEAINFEQQTLHLLSLTSGEKRSLEYQILIGSDGAGSRVRRALLPAVAGNDDSHLLDHDYKELTIPAALDGNHLIEKEALHIWPRGGYMLIALPNLDGSFTVTLFLNKTGDPSFEQLSDEASVNHFFQDQFPDAFALIPDLGKEFFENPTGILGTVRCSPWLLDESAMLIGDASHAIVPFHGQGMNAGFEDCAVFVDLLEHFEQNWTAAMREFDRTRKNDADAIADMALENYVIMRDSVRDAKFQLKKELGFLLERKFPSRFIPRYSMVMFHRIPYSDAIRRGKIQEQILNELTISISDINEVDLTQAENLIFDRLSEVRSEFVNANL